MHSSLHFKFMDIIAGFTKNKVVDMNGYLEASDDGRINLMSSSVPCAVDVTFRSNHFDDLQGAVRLFIHKTTSNIEENCLPGISRRDSRKLHGDACATFVDHCRR